MVQVGPVFFSVFEARLVTHTTMRHRACTALRYYCWYMRVHGSASTYAHEHMRMLHSCLFAVPDTCCVVLSVLLLWPVNHIHGDPIIMDVCWPHMINYNMSA